VPGKVIRIKPDGSREDVGGDLPGPYAVALKGRYAYVTTHTHGAGRRAGRARSGYRAHAGDDD
jgi:hypothetical protein